MFFWTEAFHVLRVSTEISGNFATIRSTSRVLGYFGSTPSIESDRQLLFGGKQLHGIT